MIRRDELYDGKEPENIEELIFCFPFVEFRMQRLNGGIKLNVKREEKELQRAFLDYSKELFTELYEMAKEISA